MQQRYLITLTIFCSLFQMALAQRDSLPQLTLSLGPAHLKRQDLIFSPFIHQDLSPLTFGLLYEKNKKVHQYVRLDYSGFEAGLFTPYEILHDKETETAYPHSFTFVGLDYGWGKWFGKSPTFQSLIGASFNVDIQSSTYQYGLFSFFGYYASMGAGIWYKGIYQFSERHRLSGQVELPLVLWSARSPYLVNDDEFIQNIYSHNGVNTFFAYLEDGELATWDKLQAINFGFQYQYLLSEKWSIGAGWKFGYIHAKEPLPLTSIQHNVSILLGLKL